MATKLLSAWNMCTHNYGTDFDSMKRSKPKNCHSGTHQPMKSGPGCELDLIIRESPFYKISTRVKPDKPTLATIS